VQPSQPHGGVEQQIGPRQRRVVGAHQRLVGVHAPLVQGHDRLIGHPQRRQRLVEVHRQRGGIAEQLVVGAEQLQRLPLEARQAMKGHRPLHRLHQLLRRQRLQQQLAGAECHRLGRQLERGPAGHEDHRHVEVALAHRRQQLNSVHSRHHDVADDGIEAPLVQRRQSVLAVARGHHLESCTLQQPSVCAQDGRLVVGQKDALHVYSPTADADSTVRAHRITPTHGRQCAANRRTRGDR
jgi:hypothetical protein